MPSNLLVHDEPGDSSPTSTRSSADDELRVLAQKHVERVRRLKLHAAAYGLGMFVLTPIWVLTQWQTSGGFERWSTDHSRPGDWEPWIVYVALGWGLIVAIMALRVHFDRPSTEAELDRELQRLHRARP